MTEEKESFFSSIGLFFKFNPLVLFVAFVLMNVMISVFISQMELGQKMLALVSSGFFYVVAVFYEVYRIQKEQELRERGLV